MIKTYRMKKGYTQEQLAELAGLSTRQIQRIEDNNEKTSLKTLRILINLLDIPDEDIINFIRNH